MTNEQKIELSIEQIRALLEIINKTSFSGDSIEFIANLKSTLLDMFKQKQNLPKE